MKKILIALFVLVCAPAVAQNYLREDGIFHSVVEGTTNGQVLVNNGGLLGGTTLTSIPLTVGTTSILNGTSSRILYDNVGKLGEYTLTGTGTVVAMQNAPTFTGSTTTTITRNTTPWAAAGTTSLHIVGADTGEARIEWTAANSDSVAVFGRMNNTFASPMPLVTDDQVMGLIGVGIDTAGSTTMQQGGALGGFASQNWTPTHHGYYFQFFGINDNTVDLVDFGTFRNQGLALVGGLTTAGVTATPTSGTINKGLSITQTFPSSGTPVGPILGNTIDVTNPGLGASGSGHDNFGGQSLIYGTRATMSITGASSGSGSAAFGAFTNIAAASDGFGGSHGVTITGASPAGHNAWGHIGYGIVFTGGQIGLLVGVESEMGVSAGGTASFRIGHSANSQGPVQGSTLDAAFAANTINIAGFGGNAAPWQHLMALSGSMYSGIGFPLATTGDFFFSDTAGTVANFANLANVTVTGSVLKFPNLVVPGAAAGFTLPTPAAGTTFQFGGQDSNSTNIEIDAFGGMARFVARRADGTSTAPTAVQSDESIGIITMRAYDGTAYFQAATAIARAAQNLTGSNHGSYWLFSTIPLNSTTEAEVVRIQQGLMVGLTTDPGVGVVNVLTGFRQGTMTAGRVLRADGTNFVSAQLACADLSTPCITGNQTITLSGGVSGSGTTTITATLDTAQSAVHTWALAQTFTVAPVFTDQSGSRTALGLGALATVTPGTGVATALAVNIGTAGSFVVNGGALGSPSSAGTIPAFTQGGNISGGGFQHNNVIIGASTPLAGTFTTLTATTLNGLTVTTSTGTLTVPNGVVLTGPASSGTAMTLGNTETVTGTKTFNAVQFANNTFLSLLDTGGGTASGLINDSSNLVKLVQANNAELRIAAGFSSNAANIISFFTQNSTSGERARFSNSGCLSIGSTTDCGAGSLQLNAQMFMPNITSQSTAASGSICWTTGTGKFTVDTTLACLTSSARFKNIIGEIPAATALGIVDRLRTVSFTRKVEFGGDADSAEQFGFTAEQAASVDERLIARGPDGKPLGVRYMEFTAVLAGAVQQLKANNDNLEARLARMENRK